MCHVGSTEWHGLGVDAGLGRPAPAVPASSPLSTHGMFGLFLAMNRVLAISLAGPRHPCVDAAVPCPTPAEPQTYLRHRAVDWTAWNSLFLRGPDGAGDLGGSWKKKDIRTEEEPPRPEGPLLLAASPEGCAGQQLLAEGWGEL